MSADRVYFASLGLDVSLQPTGVDHLFTPNTTGAASTADGIVRQGLSHKRHNSTRCATLSCVVHCVLIGVTLARHIWQQDTDRGEVEPLSQLQT